MRTPGSILAALLLTSVGGCGEHRQNAAQTLLADLTSRLRFQYHECVPLGWAPVPVKGTYYPGYTATLGGYALWLDAVWRGRIPRADLANPQSRQVFAVLNHLVQRGILERTDRPAYYDYFMTHEAISHFYGMTTYSNNQGAQPYLCYSTIVPSKIVSLRRIRTGLPRGLRIPWYQLSFEWKPSASESWANDPFLRSHSAILPPVTSPTSARVYYWNEHWHLIEMYGKRWLPALADASVWTQRP